MNGGVNLQFCEIYIDPLCTQDLFAQDLFSTKL